MQLIASRVLAASAPSFDFTAIPATFNCLKLLVSARSDRASEGDIWAVQFNADTGAHYESVQMNTGGGSPASSHTASFTSPVIDLAAASATANVPSLLSAEIPAYAGTTFHKIASMKTAYTDGTSNWALTDWLLKWASTAAINEIKVFPDIGSNFVAGSAAFLFGF
jgi:hypothetical protein